MKSGDIVVLKTGGPKMTVSTVQQMTGGSQELNDQGNQCRCHWFELGTNIARYYDFRENEIRLWGDICDEKVV